MAAALLAPGVTTLRNVDPVADLDVMIDVLRAIGADVEWTGERELQIDASAPLHPETPYELVTRMRASVNVLGPLLARCGEARVAMPGGDNIGSRQLDMHFRGLEAMGVELDVVHGFIEAPREPARGRARRARVPERRRHREPADRGGARQGRRPSSRTRRASRRSPSSPTMLNRMGARGARRGHVDDRDRGRGGARAGRQRDHGRPHRDRHAADGVRHRRRRDHDRRARASTTSRSSR